MSGAAMLALAGAVLTIAVRRPDHRAFAALLAARGLGALLPQVSDDAAWRWTAYAMQPYLVLASLPLVLYCALSIHPARRLRWTGWACLPAVLALCGLYAVDHAWFEAIAPGAASNGMQQAGPGLQYTSFGPLAALGALVFPLMATLGLLYALAYRTDATGPEAGPRLLLAAGFLVGGLFDGANRLTSLMDLLDHSGTYPWLPWGWAVAVLPTLGLLPAALGMAVLATGRQQDPRLFHRREAVILGLGLAALSAGFVRVLLPPSADPAGSPVVLVLAGLVRLAMPACVAAAIVARINLGAGERTRMALTWLAAAALTFVAGALAGALLTPLTGWPLPLAAATGAAVATAIGGRWILHAGSLLSSALPGGGDPAVPALAAGHEAAK